MSLFSVTWRFQIYAIARDELHYKWLYLFKQVLDKCDSPSLTPIELGFNEIDSDEETTYFTLQIYDVGLDDTFDDRCN